MADQPTDGGKVPQDRYENPEAALGGADAVEKTTYVTGKGTDHTVRPGRLRSGAGHDVDDLRLSRDRRRARVSARLRPLNPVRCAAA